MKKIKILVLITFLTGIFNLSDFQAHAECMKVDSKRDITANYRTYIGSAKGLIAVVYFNRCLESGLLATRCGAMLMNEIDPSDSFRVFYVDLFVLKRDKREADIERISGRELQTKVLFEQLGGIVFYYNGKIIDRYPITGDICSDQSSKNKIIEDGKKLRMNFIKADQIKRSKDSNV